MFRTVTMFWNGVKTHEVIKEQTGMKLGGKGTIPKHSEVFSVINGIFEPYLHWLLQVLTKFFTK